MKKWYVLGMLCLLVIFTSVPANAKQIINDGNYTTEDGDFYTKFWKEMFKGGEPGADGNTLQAVGEGFVFKKAVLLETVPVPVETVDKCAGFDYRTTYKKGQLQLNASGPWLDRGLLRASGIEATNCSKTTGTNKEILEFRLSFEGVFDNAENCKFSVEATYSGTPEVKFDEVDAPVFQRGTDYDAEIKILCNQKSGK
jgi:hypothetical protein